MRVTKSKVKIPGVSSPFQKKTHPGNSLTSPRVHKSRMTHDNKRASVSQGSNNQGKSTSKVRNLDLQASNPKGKDRIPEFTNGWRAPK